MVSREEEPMNIGVLGRGDNRGIGIQSRSFYRNMNCVKALVVTMGIDPTNGRELTPYEQDPYRFDSGLVYPVTWNANDSFPENVVRRFLDGLDAIYVVESPYDYNLFRIAREMGVATILHANPEFYRYFTDTDLPRPDVVWFPTNWLIDRFEAEGAVVMPFPVDRAHFPYRHRAPEVPTFLHVVGHRTLRDRNGTLTVYHSLRATRRVKVKLIIRSQSPMPTIDYPHVDARVEVGDVPDNATLYEEGDVLLMPRKWGGLCLPLNEALSSGIPVLMNDCPPQSDFLPPSMLVPASKKLTLRFQCGVVPSYDMHPRILAQRMEDLIAHPEKVTEMSEEADKLAESLSWETLRPVYDAAIHAVVEKVQA